VHNDDLPKQGHIGNLKRVSLIALKRFWAARAEKEIFCLLPHVKH